MNDRLVYFWVAVSFVVTSCHGSCSKSESSEQGIPKLDPVEQAKAQDLCDELMSSADAQERAKGIECVKQRDGAK